MPFYQVIEHKDAPLKNSDPIEAEFFEVGHEGAVTFTTTSNTGVHGTTNQPIRKQVAFFPKVGGVYELTGKELRDAEDKKAKDIAAKDAPKSEPKH